MVNEVYPVLPVEQFKCSDPIDQTGFHSTYEILEAGQNGTCMRCNATIHIAKQTPSSLLYYAARHYTIAEDTW